VVSTVLTPIELIKCKLQVQDLNPTAKKLTPWSILADAVKTQGIKGLYVGHAGTFIRESIGGGVWFACYEGTHTSSFNISIGVCKLMVRYTKGAKNKHDLSPSQSALAGAISGMCFNGSMFPADSIKSVQQTQDFNSSKSFIQTGLEIYKRAGIRGFYRGLGITLMRSCPSSGIMFLTFETLSKKFN
jgi:ornithine carrier protein